MLYVEQIGTQGPHIVMLHGWGQSSKDLRPLALLLADISQIHLIDLPGFGKSDRPDTVWSVYDYADRIVGYLDSQGIDKAVWAGHSFGGKVALAAGVQHGKRVDRLVLLAASGMRPRKKWGLIVLRRITRVLGIYHKWFVPKFASRDYLAANEMRDILVKSVNMHLDGEVGTIEAPALLLWGTNDRETPLRLAKRLHKLMQRAKLIVLPRKDHHAMTGVGSHLIAHHMRKFVCSSH